MCVSCYGLTATGWEVSKPLPVGETLSVVSSNKLKSTVALVLHKSSKSSASDPLLPVFRLARITTIHHWGRQYMLVMAYTKLAAPSVR